jgi:predicted transposase
MPMKLTAQVKLLTTPQQAQSLHHTLQRANAACDYVSQVAFERKVFGRFALQKRVYGQVRAQFGLSAQMAVRVIAKVADSYKLDKQEQRRFKPTGAIAFDARILSWDLDKQVVSIWTVDGRIKIAFQTGQHHGALLKTQQGESDLTMWRGSFFLNTACEIEAAPQAEVEQALGVDLGITNIASDSDGDVHSGSTVKNVRHRHRRLRTRLQRKGTKSAKRRLKQLAGKERRFGKWI